MAVAATHVHAFANPAGPGKSIALAAGAAVDPAPDQDGGHDHRPHPAGEHCSLCMLLSAAAAAILPGGAGLPESALERSPGLMFLYVRIKRAQTNETNRARAPPVSIEVRAA